MGTWSRTMESYKLSEIITIIGDVPVYFVTKEDPWDTPKVYSLELPSKSGKNFETIRQEKIDKERVQYYRSQSFWLRLWWALFPGDRDRP